MKNEDALGAVREARHQISESINHDSKNIVNYYKKLQSRHKERLISSPPTPSDKDKNAA